MAQFYTGKDKPIYCFCGELLGLWDKKDNTQHKVACPKCRRWIWFYPKTGRRCTKIIPQRQSSSGIRFY